MTDTDDAPDKLFLDQLKSVSPDKVLWDPGANGYAVYNVRDEHVPAMRKVAKDHGMKLQHWKQQGAVWVPRKGATFDVQ